MTRDTGIAQRKAMLISFGGDLVASARRNGNDRAYLSEELVEEIDEIARSPLDLENPVVFDKVREILEEKIRNA